MFYELGDAKDTLRIQFGPIDFTWRELMIGIQSSLIVVPVNLLIITIFRYTGPKRVYVSEADSEQKEQDSKAAKSKGKANKTKSEETPKTRTNTKSKETAKAKPKAKKATNELESEGRTKRTERKKSKKFKLPHWFNYIGYTLALLTSLTGAIFTMFYSMIWGKEKSNKWITSVIVSLVQDICLVQPLKVVLVASILAFLFRKPPEEERDEVDGDEVSDMAKDELDDATPDEANIKNPKLMKSLYNRPDPIAVALAREKMLNKVKMFKIFSQLGLQLFFVFLLSVASYGSRSSDRFFLSKNIQDIFNTKLGKVRRPAGEGGG